MKRIFLRVLVCVVCLLGAAQVAFGGRPVLRDDVVFPRQLYMRYVWHSGGRAEGYNHYFLFFDTNGRATVYVFGSGRDDIGKEYFFVPQRKDGEGVARLLFDFKGHGLLEAYHSREERVLAKRPRTQTEIRWESKLDVETGYVVGGQKLWTGHEVRVMSGRTRASLTRPLILSGDLSYVLVGFYDLKRGGEFEVAAPGFTKEGIIGRFRRVREEVVETKAGRFRAMKVRPVISDWLLSLVMGQMANMMGAMWYDVETGYLVRHQQSGGWTMLLDEVSDFTDFETKAGEVNEWLRTEGKRRMKNGVGGP